MRKALLAGMTILAAGIATLAGSAPAAAIDYPWCVQGREVGYPGDCSYTTYQQCQASASGRYAYCAQNPIVAFQQQQLQQTRRARAPRGTSVY
jgi:hypothetical protein